MKKFNKKAASFILYCCTIIIISSFWHIEVRAHIANGWVLSNPSNVKYNISTFVGPYTSETITYVEKWETYCSEIGISSASSNENIYFYGDFNVDNGTYAICLHHNDNYHVITYYYAFTKATASERQETIVHEVGHALGLAHCQSDKESISVMRATGFNNKAYPLSDDIAGISAIY
ncbi:MAG: matrixin family metalloprotease [Clostridium sp.]|nr:matrixin family metalloprotease [Clostridium sp.]